MLLRPFLLLALLLAPAIAADAEPGVTLIAHPDAGLATVSAEDLADVYTGRRTRWPNGTKAVPLTSGDRPTTERFLVGCLGTTPSAFAAHWKRAVFTGKGTPPAQAKDDRDMLELVRRTPGAIGFVSRGADTGGLAAVPIAR